MEDASRQPREADRAAVRQRIERAVDDGRISSADAEIRQRNVAAAQSMGELDLVARDLDQVERTLAPSAASAVAGGGGTGRARSSVWVAAVLAVVVGAAAIGAVGLLVFREGGSADPQVLGDPQPIRSEPALTASPSGGGTTSGPAYSLSAQGLRAFVATYRKRFGTTQVVDATFYRDYVVVQVPLAGGHRHSGWIYRSGSGFTDFGGQTANFPGSAAIDLSRLDVGALLGNVSRAKRVLWVQGANQVYVHLDYRPQFDPAPNVNIYLTNKFNESGYLATRLDGTVERAYPFGG